MSRPVLLTIVILLSVGTLAMGMPAYECGMDSCCPQETCCSIEASGTAPSIVISQLSRQPVKHLDLFFSSTQADRWPDRDLPTNTVQIASNSTNPTTDLNSVLRV